MVRCSYRTCTFGLTQRTRWIKAQAQGPFKKANGRREHFVARWPTSATGFFIWTTLPTRNGCSCSTTQAYFVEVSIWLADLMLSRVRRCHCWQPPPLRTVHESFPSHSSSKPVTDWLPQMARPLMAGVLALFAALPAASNIHQDKPSSLRCVAGSPVARQHPFGLGRSPIQQVMGSLCLSAAGLRFLQLPTPAEALAFPCGRVTDLRQTSTGLSCSAFVRCGQFRCLLYTGAGGVRAGVR